MAVAQAPLLQCIFKTWCKDVLGRCREDFKIFQKNPHKIKIFPQRSGPVSARANIFFLEIQIISHSLSSDTFTIFFGIASNLGHPCMAVESHGFQDCGKTGTYRDHPNVFALPKELCVTWMASCVPLCSHVAKIS